MRGSLAKLVLPVLVAASLLTAPAAAAGGDLLGSMQCPCGCGKFLTTCDCGSADEGRAFVNDLKSRGLGDAEIAEQYGERYGEDLVNFVPKKGRGLSLWLFPAVGVVVGAAAVYYRLQGGGRSLGRVRGGRSCEECGSTVEGGQSFCSSCGAELSVENCGSCGEVLPGDKNFCTSCGEPAGSSCPSCGEGVQPGANFCPSCGESL